MKLIYAYLTPIDSIHNIFKKLNVEKDVQLNVKNRSINQYIFLPMQKCLIQKLPFGIF
jgi:hypothetical protein